MRTFTGSIKLLKESFDSQWAAKRLNPATEAHFRANRKSHVITLDSGDSDRIRFYREDEYFLVLSQNFGLHYIGLQVYNTDTKECEQSLFLSGDDVDAFLGENAFDRADITLAKWMFNLFCEVRC